MDAVRPYDDVRPCGDVRLCGMEGTQPAAPL